MYPNTLRQDQMMISLTNTVETNDSMTEEQAYAEEANWEQEIEESKFKQQNQKLTSLKNTVEINDSKTEVEEYTEEANWEQEIEKQEY